MDPNDEFDLKFVPELAGQTDEEENAPPEEEAPEEDYLDDAGQGDDADDDDAEFVEVVPASQYNELRKFATQKSMELAELKKRMAAGEAPNQPEPPARRGEKSPMASKLDEIIAQQVAQQMESMLAPLREQEEEAAMQNEILELAETDPDFDNVSSDFLRTLEERPELFELPDGIGIAYKLAKADYLGRVSSARIQAEAKALSERKEMKRTLSEGSGAARPPVQKSQSVEDEIKASILNVTTPRPF